MITDANKLKAYIENNGGIVRFSDILKAGFHSDSIKILEERKNIIRIARGLYAIKGKIYDSGDDLINVCRQVPKGVICLISALAYHEVTDEIPGYVDVAIPVHSRANKVEYPPVRFYRIARKAWEAGIETHNIQGNTIKVYSLAKTIADCFKFRNRIGKHIVIAALKTAIIEKKAEPVEIMKYADICRVTKVIKPIMEAII